MGGGEYRGRGYGCGGVDVVCGMRTRNDTARAGTVQEAPGVPVPGSSLDMDDGSDIIIVTFSESMHCGVKPRTLCMIGKCFGN